MESFAKDTDGFFARHFDRKISGAISRLLLKTPVTPNQITVGVTLLGLWGGWLMAQEGATVKIMGSLVFLLTSILDGCDGEVARAKQMMSKLGGWLDLWGDNVVHVAIFYGLGIGLSKDTGKDIYLTLGKFAVLGTVASATLASYQTWKASSSSPAVSGGGSTKTDGPPTGALGGDGKSLFTSVVGDASRVKNSPWQAHLTAMADALARRDFVYGVVVLSLIHRLDWFLWACAFGSVAYACVLGVLCLFTRPSASPH
jgi:phosphatidylglycerophosphate synthase